MQPPIELTNYVKTCRQHGVPTAKIREQLLTRGWPHQLVDLALPDKKSQPGRKVAPYSGITHRQPTFVEHPLKHAVAAIGASSPEESTKVIEKFLTTELHMGEPPLGADDDDANSFRHTVVSAVHTSKVAVPKKARSFKFAQSYALTSAVIFVALAICSFAVFPHEAPQATAEATPQVTTVKDQNYRMVLPKDWKVSSDYVSGAGVNIFYQPGQSIARKARMAIFVTPTQSSPGSDHVATQIAALRQNGGTATVTNQQPLALGQSNATLTEVTATAASNPNETTSYIFMATTYGTTSYNVDVMLPGTPSTATKDSILTSLKSFRPTNTTITHKQ